MSLRESVVQQDVGDATCGGSFSISAEPFPGFSLKRGGSAAVLETGPTANLACFKWRKNHTGLLKKFGPPAAEASPACARPKFGNSRIEEIRFAADAPVEIAGRRGTTETFLVEADIPALSRKRAPESLEGLWGAPHNCLRPAKLGVHVPSNANVDGHFV